MEIKILRLEHGEKQTLGRALLIDELDIMMQWCTLELPWKDNQKRISCIPAGIYRVEKYASPKHGAVLLIKDVSNRSMIEMHSGNYYTQILGCILSGQGFTDINMDGLLDVTRSVETMGKILRYVPNELSVHIID